MKMKRFLNHFLSMSIMASVLVLTSCGEDTEDPGVDAPSFSITGVEEGEETETSVNVGETVEFTVDVTVPAGFNTLVVNQTVGENTIEYDREARPSGTPASSYSYDFSFTPNQDVVGESVIFDFIVVDDAGIETDYTYTVNVNDEVVGSYNTVLLDAPLADQSSNVWFSTNTGERYSTQEVNSSTENLSGQIDFGYRYGPSAGATLASPAQYPSEGGQNTDAWGSLNETEIRRTTITAEEFLELGNGAQYIRDAFEGGTAGTNDQRATGLIEGEVLAFMTDPDKEGGSRYGLIHVEDIEEGVEIDDNITLNVRIIE